MSEKHESLDLQILKLGQRYGCLLIDFRENLKALIQQREELAWNAGRSWHLDTPWNWSFDFDTINDWREQEKK